MKKYIAFLSLCFLISCKPPAYLPQPKNLKQHVKGLFIKVKIKGKNQKTYGKTLGEIILVEQQHIKVLSLDQSKGIITIAKKDLLKAEIIVASSSDRPKMISTWAGLINLLPLGHGNYAFVSIPLNIIATTAIGGDATNGRYSIKYPKQVSWKQMKKFARFPQGLPANIELSDIK